jgi:hypothetical protein
MTDEELIAIAREQVEGFEDPEGHCPSIRELPRTRILDAVVVYFESDEQGGKIEVFLERDSRKLIAATLIPHKPKPPPQNGRIDDPTLVCAIAYSLSDSFCCS